MLLTGGKKTKGKPQKETAASPGPFRAASRRVHPAETEKDGGYRENSPGGHRAVPGKSFRMAVRFIILVFAAASVGMFLFYFPSGCSRGEVDAYVRSVYGSGCRLVKTAPGGGTLRKALAILFPDLMEKGVLPLADAAGQELSADSDSYLYELSEEGGGKLRFLVETAPVSSGEVRLFSRPYKKGLSDHYFSAVIEDRADGLKKLAKKAGKKGVRLLIERDSGSGAGYKGGALYSVSLFLDSPDRIEAAADTVEKLDKLLAFSCGEGEGVYARFRPALPHVKVYLRPDQGIYPMADAVAEAAPRGKNAGSRLAVFTDDWTSRQQRGAFRISTIPFTDGTAAARLRKEDLTVRIENDYADAARTDKSAYYALSPELSAKYPAPVLTLVNVGGHILEKEGPNIYRFFFHRRSGTYWLVGLDPCDSFDGSPFGEYPGRGSFERLVRCLDGSCSASGPAQGGNAAEWRGSWKIGTGQWEAVQTTCSTPLSPWSHKSFTLLRNGSIVSLDEVPAVFSGTGAVPSGRPFSIRDLIKMLGVRITVNQKDMTAVMFLDED